MTAHTRARVRPLMEKSVQPVQAGISGRAPRWGRAGSFGP
jgi:hypothetical protein